MTYGIFMPSASLKHPVCRESGLSPTCYPPDGPVELWLLGHEEGEMSPTVTAG